LVDWLIDKKTGSVFIRHFAMKLSYILRSHVVKGLSFEDKDKDLKHKDKDLWYKDKDLKSKDKDLWSKDKDLKSKDKDL